MGPEPSPPTDAPPAPAAQSAPAYLLRLYVTGTSPRSSRAIVNVRSICDRHLVDRYQLEVIDITRSPALARREQVVASPTLIKHWPLPVRRFVGDMSQTERILERLDLADGNRAT